MGKHNESCMMQADHQIALYNNHIVHLIIIILGDHQMLELIILYDHQILELVILSENLKSLSPSFLVTIKSLLEVMILGDHQILSWSHDWFWVITKSLIKIMISGWWLVDYVIIGSRWSSNPWLRSWFLGDEVLEFMLQQFGVSSKALLIVVSNCFSPTIWSLLLSSQ